MHTVLLVAQINNADNEPASCIIKYHKKAFRVVEEEHTHTASVSIWAALVLVWVFVVVYMKLVPSVLPLW